LKKRRNKQHSAELVAFRKIWKVLMDAAKLESSPPVVNTALSPPPRSSITAAMLISAVSFCLPAFVRA
jgi:hypothetical protein